MLRPVVALALVLCGVFLAGCCGGEDEPDPVTPPVADPAKARTLAGRYEPNLTIERHDGFWPIALPTIDLLRSGERGICLALAKDAPCDPISTERLPWGTGSKLAFLDYPADNKDPDEQHAAIVAALGSAAPGTKAQMYFYVTGRDPDRPVSLQYWFYYPYNYLRARFHDVALFNTDLHEGDIEGVSILLSAHKHRPVYVWMPRHTEEGERFVWNQGALQRQGTHLTGFVARGGHATYESCGLKFRTTFFLGGARHIPDDYISCDPRDTYELGATINTVNLARTGWACWPGHLGYSPHYEANGSFGKVLGAFVADGPASPLFQQKFDLGNPRPCEKVPQPERPAGSPEVLADPETASALSAAGGRLNDLFRSCDDWAQRPPQGSYMVACDQGTLERFFESGLEDRGGQNLRVLGDPAPRGPTVPAVFASSESEAVDRATIRTDEPAHPEVFVAIRNERKLSTAEFPAFTMQPGQRLRLQRRSSSHWRLVDKAAGGRVVAAAKVEVTEVAHPPEQPAIVAAERHGDEIDLRFSGGKDPATRLVAFAGPTRSGLIESGRIAGAVRGDPSGKYRLAVADPAAEIHFLRIVASRDGALAASPLAAVSEAP